MSKSKSNVLPAVEAIIRAIDCYLDGDVLKVSEIPPPNLRAAVDALLHGKGKQARSTSIKTACLFLTFYKVVNPTYTFDTIPKSIRGKDGDKLLGAELKKRYVVLGNVTACFENFGSKGAQDNFDLHTDVRFRDYIPLVAEASYEDVVKTALYMAAHFAASQAIPPVLPALGADTLSFIRAKALFKSLVATRSNGFIQQFLIAALLKTLRAKQNIRVETHNPSAADKYDRTAGDIEEFVDDTLLRAYEVTVRPDWKNRLPDFRAKMDAAGLKKYIIIASGVNADDELHEPVAMALKIEPLERDIAVIDIMDFLNFMAAELTATELREAINEVHRLLNVPALGGRHEYIEAYTQTVDKWLDSVAS